MGQGLYHRRGSGAGIATVLPPEMLGALPNVPKEFFAFNEFVEGIDVDLLERESLGVSGRAIALSSGPESSGVSPDHSDVSVAQEELKTRELKKLLALVVAFEQGAIAFVLTVELLRVIAKLLFIAQKFGERETERRESERAGSEPASPVLIAMPDPGIAVSVGALDQRSEGEGVSVLTADAVAALPIEGSATERRGSTSSAASSAVSHSSVASSIVDSFRSITPDSNHDIGLLQALIDLEKCEEESEKKTEVFARLNDEDAVSDLFLCLDIAPLLTKIANKYSGDGVFLEALYGNEHIQHLLMEYFIPDFSIKIVGGSTIIAQRRQYLQDRYRVFRPFLLSALQRVINAAGDDRNKNYRDVAHLAIFMLENDARLRRGQGDDISEVLNILLPWVQDLPVSDRTQILQSILSIGTGFLAARDNRAAKALADKLLDDRTAWIELVTDFIGGHPKFLTNLFRLNQQLGQKISQKLFRKFDTEYAAIEDDQDKGAYYERMQSLIQAACERCDAEFKRRILKPKAEKLVGKVITDYEAGAEDKLSLQRAMLRVCSLVKAVPDLLTSLREEQPDFFSQFVAQAEELVKVYCRNGSQGFWLIKWLGTFGNNLYNEIETAKGLADGVDEGPTPLQVFAYLIFGISKTQKLLKLEVRKRPSAFFESLMVNVDSLGEWLGFLSTTDYIPVLDSDVVSGLSPFLDSYLTLLGNVYKALNGDEERQKQVLGKIAAVAVKFPRQRNAILRHGTFDIYTKLEVERWNQQHETYKAELEEISKQSSSDVVSFVEEVFYVPPDLPTVVASHAKLKAAVTRAMESARTAWFGGGIKYSFWGSWGKGSSDMDMAVAAVECAAEPGSLPLVVDARSFAQSCPGCEGYPQLLEYATLTPLEALHIINYMLLHDKQNGSKLSGVVNKIFASGVLLADQSVSDAREFGKLLSHVKAVANKRYPRSKLVGKLGVIDCLYRLGHVDDLAQSHLDGKKGPIKWLWRKLSGENESTLAAEKSHIQEQAVSELFYAEESVLREVIYSVSDGDRALLASVVINELNSDKYRLPLDLSLNEFHALFHKNIQWLPDFNADWEKFKREVFQCATEEEFAGKCRVFWKYLQFWAEGSRPKKEKIIKVSGGLWNIITRQKKVDSFRKIFADVNDSAEGRRMAIKDWVKFIAEERGLGRRVNQVLQRLCKYDFEELRLAFGNRNTLSEFAIALQNNWSVIDKKLLGEFLHRLYGEDEKLKTVYWWIEQQVYGKSELFSSVYEGLLYIGENGVLKFQRLFLSSTDAKNDVEGLHALLKDLSYCSFYDIRSIFYDSIGDPRDPWSSAKYTLNRLLISNLVEMVCVNSAKMDWEIFSEFFSYLSIRHRCEFLAEFLVNSKMPLNLNLNDFWRKSIQPRKFLGEFLLPKLSEILRSDIGSDKRRIVAINVLRFIRRMPKHKDVLINCCLDVDATLDPVKALRQFNTLTLLLEGLVFARADMKLLKRFGEFTRKLHERLLYVELENQKALFNLAYGRLSDQVRDGIGVECFQDVSESVDIEEVLGERCAVSSGTTADLMAALHASDDGLGGVTADQAARDARAMRGAVREGDYLCGERLGLRSDLPGAVSSVLSASSVVAAVVGDDRADTNYDRGCLVEAM